MTPFDRQVISKLDRILHLVEGISNRPRENDRKSVAHENETNQKHNAASGKKAPPLEIDPTPTLGKESDEKWYKSTKGWKETLEIIAIPFAIGYAFVTYFQWKDSRRNFSLDERGWIAPIAVCEEGPHVLAPPSECTDLLPQTLRSTSRCCFVTPEGP